MLERALRTADWLSLRAAWAGGSLLLLAAALVSVDVILRKLFTVSLGGADELSGYAFAIGTSWAFAFVLLRRANVRVDAVYHKLPLRACALLDLLALLALGVFVTYLARYGFEVMSTSWQLSARSNSALKVPLWVPQALWVAGLAVFLATLALLLLRSLAALLAGDYAAIHALLGARSIVEDAQEEAAYARELDGGKKP